MSFMHKAWAGLYKGTTAEHAIEPAIASLGVRYRTQFPFFLYHANDLPFFADFVLLDYRVVIEIDDEGHDKPEQVKKDRERTQRLREAGWLVARCTNEDAIKHPIATVNRIMMQLGLPLSAKTTDGTPFPLAAPTVPSAARSYGPGSGAARRRSRGRSSTKGNRRAPVRSAR